MTTPRDTTRNYFQPAKASKPKRKGIRRMSPKKAKELAQYTRLRELFMANNPTCAVCKRAPSTELHHREGRGKNYLNTATFVPTCSACHKDIHNRPGQARAAGWLK
jgi:hypothetical protein